MVETIRVERLNKAYGSLRAVKDVSLSVSRGEVLGLIGANGAGKSTTLECILGTKKYDSGSVSILGKDPQKERRDLFERVSVQFQESNYQERITVDELCKVIQSLYKTSDGYEDLLTLFGLSNKKKSQVNELSGGQKQRLFIVLALIPNPEVVFLDELTTGLDPKARREVWKCLADLKNKGLTILLTSHFMDEVEALCDKICILRQGETVFYGSVKAATDSSPYEKFEDAYLWYSDENGGNHESF